MSSDSYQRDVELKMRSGAVAYANLDDDSTVYMYAGSDGYYRVDETRSGDWREKRPVGAHRRTQIFRENIVQLAHSPSGETPRFVVALQRQETE